MPKRTYAARQFAEEKDIYDLLQSSTRRATEKKLLRMARERGTVLPADLDREAIVSHLASLEYSYPQIRALLAETDTADQAPKKQTSFLSTDATKDQVRDSIADVRKAREGVETYAISEPEGRFCVEVSYTQIETHLTRLFQSTTRTITIELLPRASGWALRYDALPRARKIAVALKEAIKSHAKATAKDLSNIVLSGVTDPAKRTQFFVDLMNGLKDYNLDDVHVIKVAKRASKSDGDGSDDDSEDEKDEAIVFVRSAALHGTGVHKSTHYQELRKSGFYARRASFRVIEDKTNPKMKADLEVGFEDWEECTGFYFRVRKVVTVNRRTQEFNENGRNPKADEREAFSNAIEESAQAALDKALGKAPKPLKRSAPTAKARKISAKPKRRSSK